MFELNNFNLLIISSSLAPHELREPVPSVPYDFARIMCEETHVAHRLLPEIAPFAGLDLIAIVEMAEVASQHDFV